MHERKKINPYCCFIHQKKVCCKTAKKLRTFQGKFFRLYQDAFGFEAQLHNLKFFRGAGGGGAVELNFLLFKILSNLEIKNQAPPPPFHLFKLNFHFGRQKRGLN